MPSVKRWPFCPRGDGLRRDGASLTALWWLKAHYTIHHLAYYNVWTTVLINTFNLRQLQTTCEIEYPSTSWLSLLIIAGEEKSGHAMGLSGKPIKAHAFLFAKPFEHQKVTSYEWYEFKNDWTTVLDFLHIRYVCALTSQNFVLQSPHNHFGRRRRYLGHGNESISSDILWYVTV